MSDIFIPGSKRKANTLVKEEVICVPTVFSCKTEFIEDFSPLSEGRSKASDLKDEEQEAIAMKMMGEDDVDTMYHDKNDSVDAKHGVISSQRDIVEETGSSEPVHGFHASIATRSDRETCLSESVCDVDAHLECSLGVDHEESAYVALHAKAIVLDDAIEEGFMSMDAFQDIGDDVDVFDAQTYVFDVNPDKDYDYGDAYSEGVMDDDQSMIAIGYRVCYDDVIKKEIDAIFVMHAETCVIKVERYLNGSVKLP
ncbi:hypothetical protein L7F22_021427 [Adiantum nelumboides]|nr:hypothetical protein [Adiantum nelumboides]